MVWARNALFWCVVLIGVLLIIDQIAPRDATWDEARIQEAARQIRRQTELLQPATHAIDAALAAMWRKAGVEPAPPADDLTVARRIGLALVGTIPSLEEIRWLESLPDQLRLDMWTNRLLEDRRWADYMAERLARVFVGVDPGPFLVYRRRRFVVWLADQLYEGRPYDHIVRELIEGEGLWTDHPATNFLTVTIQPNESDHPSETKLAGRVARAFLGIRIDCAECHDHPFDTWSQKDFHALAAFFGQVEQTLTGLRDGEREYLFDDGGQQAPEPIEPQVPFDRQLLPIAGRLRHRLAFWVTHPENSVFARATVNRIWALVAGRPLVTPVDNLPREGPVPAVLDVLAEDFVQNGYNLRRLIRLIVCSRAYRLESRLVPGSQLIVDSAVKPWSFTDAHAHSRRGDGDASDSKRAPWVGTTKRSSKENPQKASTHHHGVTEHVARSATNPLLQTTLRQKHPSAEQKPAETSLTTAVQDDSLTNDTEKESVSVSERLAVWAMFPVRRLLPEQLARSIIQAASLKTINHSSHIVIRTARLFDQEAFVRRYGDLGENEFQPGFDTITQRLLLMNGSLVNEKVATTLFNASGLIAELAPNEEKAIETAYLAVLTRRPTAHERKHFIRRFRAQGATWRQVMEDLFWTLINSAEFSWNH